MTPDASLALDQEALERAVMAKCAAYASCLCQAAGGIDNLICARSMEGTEAAIHTYLTAIRYPQQRAVVEAAREWGSAVECAEDADNTALQDGSPTALSHADGAWTQANKARASLQAAVAALEGRTDGR